MFFDIATLDAVAAGIGAPVPNGDPGAIFALADQLEASERLWGKHAEELARWRSRLRSFFVGDTVEALDKNLAELLNGPDSLWNDAAALRAGVKATLRKCPVVMAIRGPGQGFDAYATFGGA
jgi:hypothetical protein